MVPIRVLVLGVEGLDNGSILPVLLALELFLRTAKDGVVVVAEGGVSTGSFLVVVVVVA